MAKGNDGNLLQHGVEAMLGQSLFDAGGGRGLHIILTHGMSPYEAFEQRSDNPGAIARLDRCLRTSSDPPLQGQHPLIKAYHVLHASSTSYPNSGEILAALVGREHLCGYIAETEQPKVSALRSQWQCRRVHILHGSWRSFLDDFRCPGYHSVPWLISMDPMTFVDSEPQDDNRLRPSDLAALCPVLDSYIRAGQAGAACIFCFSLQPARQADFRTSVRNIIVGSVPALRVGFLDTTARGGNRHVGAILSPDLTLLTTVANSWHALPS